MNIDDELTKVAGLAADRRILVGLRPAVGLVGWSMDGPHGEMTGGTAATLGEVLTELERRLNPDCAKPWARPA